MRKHEAIGELRASGESGIIFRYDTEGNGVSFFFKKEYFNLGFSDVRRVGEKYSARDNNAVFAMDWENEGWGWENCSTNEYAKNRPPWDRNLEEWWENQVERIIEVEGNCTRLCMMQGVKGVTCPFHASNSGYRRQCQDLIKEEDFWRLSTGDSHLAPNIRAGLAKAYKKGEIKFIDGKLCSSGPRFEDFVEPGDVIIPEGEEPQTALVIEKRGTCFYYGGMNFVDFTQPSYEGMSFKIVATRDSREIPENLKYRENK